MDSLKQLWKEKKFKSYENVQYKREEKEEGQKSNELFNKLKKYYSFEKIDSPDFEKMVGSMKNEIFKFQKKQKL